MTDRKLAWIAGGLAVLALLIVLFRPAKNIIQQVSTGEPINVGAASPSLGPWFDVGGVERWGTRMVLNTSTSTPCRIQSPAATSTLVSGSIDFKNIGTTSVTTIEFASSTNPTATTTRIGSLIRLLSGSQSEIVASTTDSSNVPVLFPPSTWWVVKMGSTGAQDSTHPQLFSPTGSCQAVFERLVY